MKILKGLLEKHSGRLSEWKVSSQYIGGERMYTAMRVLDVSQPQHSGNVETSGKYVTDRDAVQALVDRLNNSQEGSPVDVMG